MEGSILVADDEPKIVKLVKSYLEASGFSVETALDGNAALAQFHRKRPDLVVLDLMMPGLDGLEVLKRLRREADVPVILLTARGEEADRIAGLEVGADDYVVKPFSPRELAARVKAVLRRRRGDSAEPAGVISAGALRLDPVRRTASWRGRPIELTAFQFDLLSRLASSPGRVFTRAQLVESMQGRAFEGYERTIDAHVKNLRRALADDAENPSVILTVRGVGYKLAGEPR